MQALRRQISSNIYVPDDPRDRADPRGQAISLLDTTSASRRPTRSIIYMMDVSGSMTDDQKEIVRTAAFWLDTWLRSQYDGVETRYIIHDAAAKEVDEETFYHTRESGGTRISSAYKVCAELDRQPVPAVSEWNIYCFQFSDGDNWGEDNEQELAAAARRRCCPRSTCFATARSKAPTAAASIIRSLQRGLRRDHREPDAGRDRKQRSDLRHAQAVLGQRANERRVSNCDSRASELMRLTRTSLGFAIRQLKPRPSTYHGYRPLSNRCPANWPTCRRRSKAMPRGRGWISFPRSSNGRGRRTERHRRLRRVSRPAIRTGGSAWNTSSCPRATTTGCKRSTSW